MEKALLISDFSQRLHNHPEWCSGKVKSRGADVAWFESC